MRLIAAIDSGVVPLSAISRGHSAAFVSQLVRVNCVGGIGAAMGAVGLCVGWDTMAAIIKVAAQVTAPTSTQRNVGQRMELALENEDTGRYRTADSKKT